VFGQYYTLDASALGLEFQVNELEEGNQYRPDVAMAEDCSAAVVYENSDLDERVFGVLATLLDPDGQAIGSVRLHEDLPGSQMHAAVAALDSGFLALWSGPEADSVESTIHGRLLGAGDGHDFLVAPLESTIWRLRPDVAWQAGLTVAVWQQTSASGRYQIVVAPDPAPGRQPVGADE